MVTMFSFVIGWIFDKIVGWVGVARDGGIMSLCWLFYLFFVVEDGPSL